MGVLVTVGVGTGVAVGAAVGVGVGTAAGSVGDSWHAAATIRTAAPNAMGSEATLIYAGSGTAEGGLTPPNDIEFSGEKEGARATDAEGC